MFNQESMLHGEENAIQQKQTPTQGAPALYISEPVNEVSNVH